MPLYMAQFVYTPQAWAALIRVPQDRAAASEASVRHVGGRLIGLYYTGVRRLRALRGAG
jgi:hypothetical protein